MKTVICTILLINILFANLKIGDNFPDLILVDQFGENIEVQRKNSAKVILSFEKGISLAIKKFLLTKENNYLEDNNISYISDVSTLPSFLLNWFVLPKLKELPFKVALIYGDDGETLNRKDGKISFFRLKNGKIVKIEFLDTKELELLTNLKSQ